MPLYALAFHKENVCLQRSVQCPLSPECDANPRAAEVEAHIQECPYRVVECVRQCGIEGLRFLCLEDHLENSCPHRLVECQYGCGGVFQLREMDKHHKECPNVPMDCPNGCGKQGLIRDKVTHSAWVYTNLHNCFE